ncbi:MAG: hypothetical protein GPJ51_11995 [Candidatus Heimdallarchaeota archaeon]|nr:hypothetical protein [Candidatus Heimdallarchaeota archaeon]
MSETEDIFFQEKNKIKELEKKLASIKNRIYIYLGFMVLLLCMWSIFLGYAGSRAYIQLIHWGSILGLTFGSLVCIGLLLMFVRFIKFLVIPEPGAPMVSKEEREEDDYAARKLTACSDCMVVYDARRLNCPECGKETMRKEKKSEETLLED